MLYKIDTEVGVMSIEKGVIGSIVTDILDRQDGKVWISNHKGRILGRMARISGIDPVDYMEISMDGEELQIKIYLILRFGMSIRTISQQLIDEIKEAVLTHTGITSHITIVINGLLSKQVAKRNIEIRDTKN